MPDAPAEPVGLIGLGLMGSAMAARFLEGGLPVVGFDVDPGRNEALRDLGGRVGSGPVEVVAACPRVVLSLPDSPQVESVLSAVGSSLRSGQILIDTTTGDPDFAALAASNLRAIGVAFLDACVSGSSAQVRAADATVMAGGSFEAFESCLDLFARIARRADWVGPPGSGLRMKLVSNLALGLNRAALAESLALARALGLDLDRALEVLRHSAAYSRAMDAKGDKMLRGDFSPQARLGQHHKDVRLMLSEAGRHGLELPLTRTHAAILERAEASGWGGLDNSAIFLTYGDGGAARPVRPSTDPSPSDDTT